MTQYKNKLPYITGIDGLRTLAVMAVMGYHLLPTTFKGGYLGVSLFFVISGYLMTTILYRNKEQSGKINLKRFYIHRFRRLLPSLIILLVSCGAVFVWINKDLIHNFRGVTLSSLFFYNNWWQLSQGASYFDQFNQVAPFTNLWSLSVEGQFYIFWPIILGLLLYFVKKQNLWKYISVGALLSAIEMGLLYQPETINRIYYGTDTRLFALLLGASLGVLLPLNNSWTECLKEKKKSLLLGGITFLITLAFFLFASDQSPWIYRGGMFLFSILSTLLLALVIQSKIMNHLLTNPIFKYIGQRSYELYLWQFPIMIAYETIVKPTGSHRALDVTIELLIIFMCAELTYQLVHHFMSYVRNWLHNAKPFINFSSKKTLSIIISLMIIFSSFSYSLVTASSGPIESAQKLKKTLTKKEKQLKKQQTQKVKPKTKQEIQKLQQQSQQTPVALTEQEILAAQQLQFSAFGDSVLLDAAPDLMSLAPHAKIDAVVGRQFKDAPSLIQQSLNQGTLQPNVVLALGTNGRFEQDDLESLIKQCGDRHIFLVNTLVPKYWQDEVNSTLNKVAKKFNNVYLINWYQLAKLHPDWFGEDGVHMGNFGSQMYANLVIQQLLKHSASNS